MTTEQITLRQVKVTLFQDVDGRWGYTIGTYTVPATFSRGIAVMSAQRFIANGFKR